MDSGPRPILSTPGEVAGLAFSTLVVGSALYALTLVAGPLPGYRTALAGAGLIGWCYCDGILGQLHWGLASLEGLLRLRLALEWTALLFNLFPQRGGAGPRQCFPVSFPGRHPAV